MDHSQARYQGEVHRRIRPSKPVTEGTSVFLDIYDQVAGKDKLYHHDSGPLRLLSVDKRTATIQRENVIEHFSLARLVVAPKHLSTSDTHRNSSISSGMHAKTQGLTFVFKRLVAHHQRLDHSIEFKSDWEGDYLAPWEPRAKYPEESISRYHIQILQKPL